MASSSALRSAARSCISRPNSSLLRSLLPQKPIPTSPFASSTRPSSRTAALRVISGLFSLESMMPLHSAIASARLISSLSLDSSCWSPLSEDFAVPR